MVIEMQELIQGTIFLRGGTSPSLTHAPFSLFEFWFDFSLIPLLCMAMIIPFDSVYVQV